MPALTLTKQSIFALVVDTLKMFGGETCTTGEPTSNLVIPSLKKICLYINNR